MFRRIASYIIASAVVLGSLAPAAAAVAANGKQDKQERAARGTRGKRKLAPEFAAVPNSAATVRVVIQTKGAPTVAQNDVIRGARGSKRASYAEFNTVVADVPLNMPAEIAAREDVWSMSRPTAP